MEDQTRFVEFQFISTRTLDVMMPFDSQVAGQILFWLSMGGLILVYAWLAYRAFRQSLWWGAAILLLFPVGGILYIGELMAKTKAPLYLWIVLNVTATASMILLDLGF